MTEDEYRRITQDLTLAIAEQQPTANSAMLVVYISGSGADSSEQLGKAMLNAARFGGDKVVLEAADIKRLTKKMNKIKVPRIFWQTLQEMGIAPLALLQKARLSPALSAADGYLTPEQFF